jgi:GWxTD domain-containing protein
MTLANALGWTLIHSVWEGAAASLLLALGLCFMRSPRTRYLAGCLALAGILAGFCFTFFCLLPNETSIVSRAAQPHSSTPGSSVLAAGAERMASMVLPPWLAPLWLAGVLLFQLRLVGGWMTVRRLRGTGVMAAPDHWQVRLKGLCTRLGVTGSVELLQSSLAEVPVVIGHLRPVILVPLGLLAHMPGEQLESILLHELAHIRRHDYMVNLVQTLAEGLVFYHPAVWWISSLIRAERENCCDDLAVAAHGDAHQYAVALAALADNRWGAERIALAATGGSLMKRIRRLLQQPEGPRLGVGPAFAACVVLITCGMGIMGHVAQLAAAPQQRAETPDANWVKHDVSYIITDRERLAYKRLGTDEERAEFIKQFWELRNPTPGSATNPFKEEHYRRVAYADTRYTAESSLPGWKTDRGRIYIMYGPADEIESHPAGGSYERPAVEGGGATVTYPFEQWKYRWIEGIGTNIIIEFFDKGRNGEYRMTMDPKEKEIK